MLYNILFIFKRESSYCFGLTSKTLVHELVFKSGMIERVPIIRKMNHIHIRLQATRDLLLLLLDFENEKLFNLERQHETCYERLRDCKLVLKSQEG